MIKSDRNRPKITKSNPTGSNMIKSDKNKPKITKNYPPNKWNWVKTIWWNSLPPKIYQ